MKRLGKMVFVIVASFCLSQEMLYLAKQKKEVPKSYIVQVVTPPNKNKNIDDLFINFLLR